jgi:hypothetical protein
METLVNPRMKETMEGMMDSPMMAIVTNLMTAKVRLISADTKTILLLFKTKNLRS